MPDQPALRPSRLHRWLRLALIFATVALLAWLGWRAVRTGLYARAALHDLDRLQAVLASPSLAALPQAQADLASLQTHLTEARAAGQPFLRIAPRLGWAPRYGPDLVAAPQLVDLAVEVVTGGREAADALAPVAGLLSGGDGIISALPEAVAVLAANQGALAAANAHLARAADLRATLPPPAEPRLVRLLARLDQFLPLAQDGLAVAQVAPALLGADRPVTYLLLAQNSDELRATGGFISGAGHVTLDRGQLTTLVLSDSYAVDNWDQPHPPPPAALRQYMAADLWVLRDSNWYPDFPTSADVARALYLQDRGIATDGAIALDLEAVRSLVGAVGPLQVPGIAEPVTGDNTLQWMQAAWAAPAGSTTGAAAGGAGDWWLKRKDFMGELVKASLAKVESGADLDLVALARALYGALAGRHIQAAVDEPTLAGVLAQRGWDGAVRMPEQSDFLLVVDSNVGFNKANLFVKQALDYRVATVMGRLEATLTLTYTHGGPASAEPICDRTPRYGKTYEDMAARCYFDYLRVYAPAEAELLDVAGLASVATEPGEQGATVFAGDFTLQPGQVHTVVLRYRLPAWVPANPYRLAVRKQAGVPAWPLTVTAGGCQQQAALATDVQVRCPSTTTRQSGWLVPDATAEVTAVVETFGWLTAARPYGPRVADGCPTLRVLRAGRFPGTTGNTQLSSANRFSASGVPYH